MLDFLCYFKHTYSLQLYTIEVFILFLIFIHVSINTKVTGAFVCGTAGEGTSLTIAERKQVVAKWVEASKKRIDIIAHIGSNWYLLFRFRHIHS